jgi:4-carboxymuconolactone decarboxylase
MQVEVRLPYIKPQDMTEEQRDFYEAHNEAMKDMPYTWMLDGGELNGPSNSLLHNVTVGKGLFAVGRQIIRESIQAVGLAIHELAILAAVTGANAAYAVWAHTILAQKAGLSDDKIAAVVAGHPSPDFTHEERVAYELATALLKPGPIPTITYDRSVETFGEMGTMKLIYAIGSFKNTATILNAYNEPIPADERARASHLGASRR